MQDREHVSIITQHVLGLGVAVKTNSEARDLLASCSPSITTEAKDHLLTTYKVPHIPLLSDINLSKHCQTGHIYVTSA